MPNPPELPADRDGIAEASTDRMVRAFFESPGVMRGIIELVDDDLLHVAANTASAEFAGRAVSEIRGRRASELGVPTELVSLIRERCQESLRTGAPARFDYKRTIPGRDERHLRAWYSPIGAGSAGPRFAYSTADVTERERREDESQERARILRAFFDSPGALRGVVEVAGDDIICVVANQTTAGFAGLTPDQLAGRTGAELGLSAENRRVWIAQFEQSRESGEPESFVSQHTLGGTIHSLRVVVNYVGAGVAGPRFTFSAEDITAFATAEHALRRSEESYATLVRNLSGAVYRCRNDAAWTVEFISDGCFAITGFSADDLIESRVTSLGALMHPDDAEPVWNKCQANLAARRECSNEYRILHRDGSVRWVWDRAQGIYSESGEFLCVEGLLIDITERRNEAEERQALREQLFHAQRVDSIGRLAGGVAHDFNNLLAVILGHTDLIAQQLSAEHPLREHLAEIRSATERSTHLTRQLLGFARRQPIAPRVIDLNQAVSDTLRLLRRLIGEGVDVRWAPDAAAWPMRIDPTQLDQILTNLCVNSRDAVNGLGHITIATANATLDAHFVRMHPGSRTGEYVELLVADNGCGMDSATMAHIFDPFFTTKPLGEGTGLGLATVYGIVKQNDGYIAVESTPGAGTSVRVYLPRHAEPADETPDAVPVHDAEGGTETILLVEDEAALLRLGKRVLDRMGYTVLAAATPQEAIRLAAIHMERITLLVTDIVMPGMNGRELADALKGQQPGLAVLFMSGYPDAAFEGSVRDPSVHFIEKPFSAQQLAAKVREALGDEPLLDAPAGGG